MNEPMSSHATLWELIKETRFAMLAHRHADGTLHSHPLTTQNDVLDEGGNLYFFVSKKSEVGQRLQSDGSVNLAYANPKQDTWVSVSGTARVLNDPAKKKELFGKVMNKAWFSGPDDPDLELIAVSIAEAEYWNVKESKLLQLLKMAKSAATGTPPKLGEHEELHFH